MHKKVKTGGRRKGTPNKVTVEARAAAALIVDDPIYRRTLARDMRARTVQPAIESLLWHYAKGKPKDVVEITGSLDVTARAAQIAEVVRNMTDEELAEYDALERQQEALLARVKALPAIQDDMRAWDALGRQQEALLERARALPALPAAKDP